MEIICTVSLQFSFVIHNANFDTAQLNWTFGDTFLCGYVCKCKGKVHLVLVQDAIDKRSYRTIDNFLTIMSNFCTLNRNVSGLIKMQNHMIFFSFYFQLLPKLDALFLLGCSQKNLGVALTLLLYGNSLELQEILLGGTIPS